VFEGYNHEDRSTYVDCSEAPAEKLLHKIISERSRQHPERVALRFKGQSLSYGELEERSNRVAAFLVRQGALKGDRIGVILDRSLNMVVALLAIWKTGAAYVPFDPDFPAKRIGFMLDDSGAAMLLTSRKWGGLFHGQFKEVLLETAWEETHEWTGVDVSGSELAYIIYTSGSTGRPKGVMVEHHSVVNLFQGMLHMPGIREDDRVLALTTIAFDIAVVEMFLPLFTGAQVVLADKEVARDGRSIVDIIRTEKITVVQATPVTWKMMLHAGWTGLLDIKAICGGEAMTRQLADKLCACFGSVYNLYGPTETTIYATGAKILPGNGPVTIGTPLQNTQVYILDPNMGIVPDGMMGEICIAGEGLARGYINLEKQTSERFVTNPYSHSGGAHLYRSGDMGRRMPDGNIEFLGRLDQQIKIRGHRVELGEIEYHLHNQPGVKDAVVLLKEDRPDDQQLVAYIATDVRFSREQIAAWRQKLKTYLPTYMLPGIFVLIEEMPLTVSGKIDKKALLGLSDKTGHGSHYEAPTTDMERLVAGIWCEVLDLEETSVLDDFFELGGHSLVALEMMTLLEERTGIRLPMSALFHAPTIRKLSKLLESKERPSMGPLVPIKPSGRKPPLYIVHGIGLTVMVFHSMAAYMDPDQPIFGIQAWGLEEGQEPMDTIEDLANLYVTEILKHNPDGPYFLVGYSMGGTIVFEMARQLRALGKEIKLLAMFDSYAGDIQPKDGLMQMLAYQAKRQPTKALFLLQNFLQQPLKAARYQGLVLQVRSRQLLRLLRLMKNEEGGFREKLKVRMNQARLKYQLIPNEEDVLELFRVKERIYYVFDRQYLGWKPYMKKGIHVIEAAGDHKTFLEPPHDREVAVALQKLIDGRLI
jgi:amino acid adenylation domain-containing protein